MTPPAAPHPLASLLAGFARLLTGVQVRWWNTQPSVLGGRRVVYANHTSHLDALVLWAALPAELRACTRPVAARDYWNKSPLRVYLADHVFRAVLIDRPELTPALALRATRAIVDQMAAALEGDSSLIVFPEGTRGSGKLIKPFKSGIYYLARRVPELDFTPAYLENMNRILPKGEIFPVPLLGRVTFGPPLRLTDGEPKRVFLERAQKAVLDLQEV